MSRPASSVEIEAAILDEAAAWLVQLRATDATTADRQAWQLWHDQNPAHARAWMRAEQMLGRLGQLPGELARPALNRPHDAMRRQMLGKFMWVLAAAPTTWAVWRYGPEWTADYQTATGEQRHLTLADGSQIVLNTASALDVLFDAQQRRLHLIRGEVLVETARDLQSPSRPFLVVSAQGIMRALGTRFNVQQLERQTRLTVLEGAVEVRLRDAEAPHRIIQAGETVRFTWHRMETPEPAFESDIAWRSGMLIVDALPLADLLAELSRYRPGILRCDPAVAELRVSGAFPLNNPDRSLSMLQTTYPVEVRYATRYWVTVTAR